MKKNFAATFASLLLPVFAPAAAQAAELTWITDVKLVSPEKLDHIDAGSVLIEDGIIRRVERRKNAKPPKGARIVSGHGAYLAPGLIDSHVHLQYVPGIGVEIDGPHKEMLEHYFSQLPRSYLYFGYTTVIDLAVAERSFIDRFKAAPLHPDVLDCDSPLAIANGYPMNYLPPEVRFAAYPNFIYDATQTAKIPAQFRPQDHTPAAGASRVAAAGGICIKTTFERGFGGEQDLPVMSPAQYGEVRAAASAQKLVLVTHANSFEAQRFAVDGKTDVLAHGMWNWSPAQKGQALPAEIKSLLDEIVDQRIGYQPTMQVLQGLRAYFEPTYLQDPALAKVVPADLLAWFKSPEGGWYKKELGGDAPDAAFLRGIEVPVQQGKRVVNYLAGKDANILFGTDTPSSPTYGNLPGLNGYREMQQLHMAGLSLVQIFKAATINNAKMFKLDAKFGSIEAGKVANLVLMKKSPLADIEAYDSIDRIWLHGKEVTRSSLAAPAK